MLKEIIESNESEVIYDSGVISQIGRGIETVLYQSSVMTEACSVEIYFKKSDSVSMSPNDFRLRYTNFDGSTHEGSYMLDGGKTSVITTTTALKNGVVYKFLPDPNIVYSDVPTQVLAKGESFNFSMTSDLPANVPFYYRIVIKRQNFEV